MSLVLALEPDPKQAAILKQVVRDRVGADVVLVDSKDGAIAAIAERVPDLILVTALLSPRDEADLTDQLRGLDGAEHLQTLTIPLLASGAVEPPKPKKRGLLSALTGESPKTAAPIGCDPRVFGEEIRNYLTRAEDAKAAATAERGRFAKRAASAGRKRVGGATGASRGKRPVPPADDEVAGAGSYWSWDSSTPAPGVTAAPPLRATAVAPPAPAVPVDPLPPPPHPTSSYSSSWANPWDVSKTPQAEPPVDAATVLAGTAESSGELGAAPIIYLDDHQLPADALVPSAAEAAVEQLLSQPATLSAAELVAEAPAPDAAESSTSFSAMVAPVAPDVAVPAPAAESDAPHPPRGAHASDEEFDLSSLLEGAPTLLMDSDTDPLTDVYSLSKDSFDLSALISQALDRPVPHTAASHAAGDGVSVGPDGLAAESQALLDMKADLDRLRADREDVEHALAEARAAQERAEHAAAEASAKAQEDVARHTREVTARAREEAAAERRTREQQEREALEEAERRLRIERAARAEAERLAREVETRMREEAEAERRLRAEAERQVAEAEVARAREATERLHHQEAERQAREQAEQRAGAERRAREEAEARADAERHAREAAEQKNKDEAARLAQEAEERTSHERRGREQAEARFEAERLAREAAEKKGKEDAERLALEAAEQRRAREAERKSREEAERRAQLEADARAAAEQRAREDFERLERERAAQAAREAEERKAQQETERLAREQAEQAARADAERRVAEERKARREAERLARREADRRAEAERRAREEAERVAAEAAVKAKEEARAERKARELAERRVTEERKARELAERKAREEAARRAAAEVRAKKEAEERERERDRRASSKKPVVIRKGKRRPVSASVSKPVPGKEPRPTQDEWGLYDPDKCGFGALLAKLEQLENGDVPDDDRTGEPISDSGGNGVPSTGRSPRPLSMWAWRAPDAPDAPTVPAAPVAPDDFRALVDRLKIPAAVAAVSYASGVRIGRVKIPRRRRGRTAKADAPIIILSRKLLAAARRESAAPTARLTARR